MKRILFTLLFAVRPLFAATLTTCDEASLRNALADGGSIQLSCDGTIVLSNTLVVTRDVTLSGAGHTVTISGHEAVGLFSINAGVQFSINHLVLADGRNHSGGAIFNEGGTVLLTDCVLRNHWAVGTNLAGITPTSAQGGAIFNRNGTVTLVDSTLLNNASDGSGAGAGFVVFGGAIYDEGGQIIATNCTFNGNSARGANGQLVGGLILQAGAAARGGAIYTTNGNLRLVGTLFTNNVVTGGSGAAGSFTAAPGGLAVGGALATENATSLLLDTVFVANSASGGSGGRAAPGAWAAGGAIYATGSAAGSDLQIANSRFANNSARPGFGRQEGAASVNGDGGAIYNTGPMKIRSSTFATNSVYGAVASDRPTGGPAGPGRGGAVYNEGQARIETSTFIANLAVGGNGVFGEGSSGYHSPGNGSGGAIYNANQLFLSGGTLVTNVALGGPGSPGISMTCFCTGSGGNAQGGAIYSTGSFAITNSTFNLNAALGGNAGATSGFGTRGWGGNASGGAIYSPGLGQIHYVTLADNRAIGGEGIFNGAHEGGNLTAVGQVTLGTSILASTIPGGQCAGNLIDSGYNLSSDAGCYLNGPGSLNNVNPRLGPLADNGGPTMTMALLADSPAIDAAEEFDCPSTDQRGQPRPALAHCDIGAYEKQPDNYVITSLTRSGDQVLLRGSGIPSTSFRVEASAQLGSWQQAGTGDVDANGSFTVLAPVLDGTQCFFRIIAP